MERRTFFGTAWKLLEDPQLEPPFPPQPWDAFRLLFPLRTQYSQDLLPLSFLIFSAFSCSATCLYPSTWLNRSVRASGCFRAGSTDLPACKEIVDLLTTLTERPRVFFDIQIGDSKAGRIVFELVSINPPE